MQDTTQTTKIADLKPGDKFTVEFTVNDNGVSAGDWRSLYPVGDPLSLFRTITPTSITRAPRIPKAGYRYTRRGQTTIYEIVFIDDISVVARSDAFNTFILGRREFDRSVLQQQRILV